MEKTWKILFVDDDPRYAAPLIDMAFSEFGLELEYYDNWEEAFSNLTENFELYHGVIIDGKGKLRKDSKDDDQKHVSKAIGDLRELRGNKQYIPYVILSKYLEIKDAVVEPFFEKGLNEKEMFDFLIKEIQNLADNKIRIKYQDAFAAFGDNYLDKSAEENLLEAIRSFENNNWNHNSFTPLRKIIEAVYKSIHEKDDELIPYACLRFENNQINFTYCERRLKGQTINERGTGPVLFPAVESVLPRHLRAVIAEFTKLCSRSMHADYRDNINKFTHGSCLFFVIDLLIWYKNFVDENYSI